MNPPGHSPILALPPGTATQTMSESSETFVPMRMGRLVLRDRSDQQWIQLVEVDGSRSFPIVIGTQEARELQRVLTGKDTPRPLTHQLALAGLEALGGALDAVRITDLRDNTFYAELRVRTADGEVQALDARPSDALAIGLRAGCALEIAESILEEVRTDEAGPDPLPETDSDEDDPPTDSLFGNILDPEA